MPGLSEMFLTFRLSGGRLALPADCVAEIVLEPRLDRLPTAPPVVAGVMNLRGDAVPVLRAERILGRAEPVPAPFRAVIVLSRPPPAPWALLVDRADDVAPASLSAVPPDMAFDDCVCGVLVLADGLVPLLSPERLLRRREADALEAFRDRAAERLKEFSLDR